ncbi:DEAD/DEAH box helicase [Caulobacter sp. UNC279MFTsu5.1]|uniref:DEAD/DEAH box helicase n=1 Tax=Caulobacter sp. UNC279MFTsu5.1 TaxID=1502775 RepID=UPI0008DF3E89|nr:DEAD/DEAH box helicase [Caulobacter sp. UNC279MFTsu5.1]SFK19782.1 ATP-dependent RNA helicase DeaD [Caulobacter sp. UNC279MFTsu5.1]
MPFPASHPALERALAAQGYLEPTPVQAAVLEADANGRDLLVSAQTGSGKTVAFGLAAAPTLLGDADRFEKAGAPMCLVIAPTRELAIQVNRELTWLYAEAGAVVVNCVGGMDARREQRALNFGAHIVVGTPGRLRDHIERGHLDLSELKVAVLDEADEMLDMGFREDLEFILDAAPKERRTLLFSATLAREIIALARNYQDDALRIDTIGRNEPHRDIEYRAVRVAPNEVEHAVVNLLRYFESPGALVFANTRESVRALHSKLRERGFAVVGLSGELSQRERADALQALRDGHARVCVATDVAARGLDLPDLGLVIHAELPVNKATLLHRSGRTGRAGKKGVSALVVPYTRRRKAEQLLMAAGVEGQWGGAPTADEIRVKDTERLLDDPIFAEASNEDDAGLVAAMLEKRTPEELAAALIRARRAKLPAPEEIYDDPRHGADPGPRVRGERSNDRGDRFADRDFAPRGDFGDRPEREPRADMTNSAWFRLNTGRRNNADPKWLIPLICRLGHITKKDIGSIRIFDYDTKFEISAEAEVKFGAAVQATVRDDVTITPTTAPAARDAGPRKEYAPRPPRDDSDAPRREYAPRPPRDNDRGPRANAPGSRDHTPRPSAFGADGVSNAKPYDRGQEPKRDYKPRANDHQRGDEAPKRDFKPRAEGPKREFKPRDEAPRAHAEAAPRRAPRTDRESVPYDPAATPEKPFRKPRADAGAAPAKPFKGPKPFKAPKTFKSGGDFGGKPAFGGPKPAFGKKPGGKAPFKKK